MADRSKVIRRAKNIRRIKGERLRREKEVFMKLGAKLRAYLFTGILVTAPVAITFYLAYKFIFWVDALVNQMLPPQYQPGSYLPMSVPGLGLIVLIVFLILVGMFAAGFLGSFFIRLGEWFVARVPLISSIYSLLKQIFETVFSSKTQAFKKVVMLEYPRKGIWILGLVSADLQGEVEAKLPEPMVNVFIPTTPNPTSGFLIFVPKKDVIEMDMPVEEAIKFIVSGGLVEPKKVRQTEK